MWIQVVMLTLFFLPLDPVDNSITAVRLNVFLSFISVPFVRSPLHDYNFLWFETSFAAKAISNRISQMFCCVYIVFTWLQRTWLSSWYIFFWFLLLLLLMVFMFSQCAFFYLPLFRTRFFPLPLLCSCDCNLFSLISYFNWTRYMVAWLSHLVDRFVNDVYHCVFAFFFVHTLFLRIQTHR